MEIHRKKAGPDCHRLKTMVNTRTVQNLRLKTFEARNGNYERNAVVKNQGTKQHEQRTSGDCWQWKANGQELAPIHFVKKSILQNACSTSRRLDADLGKSALMRIARLKSSLAKGQKRIVTKVQWLC